MNAFHGSCHCGNVRVVYRSRLAPESTTPRACQCSFCRKQNTRMVSDPAGQLDIHVRDSGELARYRFGLGVSDYLSCRICGVYVGSFMVDADGAARLAQAEDDAVAAVGGPSIAGLATLSANLLEAQSRFPAASPIDYDGEGETAKRERRRQRWTPARLVIEG